MSPGKQVEDWGVDEVGIWLNCIGLGDKVEPFRENTVDGETLENLTKEELVDELGLTNLQAKKVLRMLDTTKEMASGGGGNPEKTKELEAKVAELLDEVAARDIAIKELKEEVSRLQKEAEVKAVPEEIPEVQAVPVTQAEPVKEAEPVAQAPPPQQPQQPQSSPRRRGRGAPVLGGAARGAAGGAAKGAIAGAILPGMEASDGAAAGAAVGAFSGGTKGIGKRLGRR